MPARRNKTEQTFQGKVLPASNHSCSPPSADQGQSYKLVCRDAGACETDKPFDSVLLLKAKSRAMLWASYVEKRSSSDEKRVFHGHAAAVAALHALHRSMSVVCGQSDLCVCEEDAAIPQKLQSG